MNIFQLAKSTNKATIVARFAHQFSDEVLVKDEYVSWFIEQDAIDQIKDKPFKFEGEPKDETEEFVRFAYWYIILREKHGDEAIEKAIAAGCKQLLLLGSGYDTRFFRLPAVRDTIPTFEVDLPKTINDKKKCLMEKLGSIPDRLSLIAIDFNEEDFSKLFSSGFDRNIPTAYIWQGVSYYLRQDAVSKLLDFVKAQMVVGSTFVFDFCTPLMTYKNDKIPGIASNIDGLKKVGEPFLFAMYPAEMEDWLKSKGFEHIKIMGANDLEVEFLHRRTLPDNSWYVAIAH
jgi:methyltransferase (TIGR00027 family)